MEHEGVGGMRHFRHLGGWLPRSTGLRPRVEKGGDVPKEFLHLRAERAGSGASSRLEGLEDPVYVWWNMRVSEA